MHVRVRVRVLTLHCFIAVQTVMGIQHEDALLGDVPRYWAFIARALEEHLMPMLQQPGMSGCGACNAVRCTLKAWFV